MKYIKLAIFCCIILPVFGQNSKKLFLNAYLHVGNGSTMPSAAVGVEGNKIILVKNSLAFSFDEADWDTIIDLKGDHMYPGFVAPNSTLGIVEIDAVRSTRDFHETGTYNPHVRSQIAYNPESKVIATVRANGVLLIQSTPRGGSISGSSSVMKSYGWNWEDATVLADDGVHINWPEDIQGGGWWAEPQDKKANEKYQEELSELEKFVTDAKAYAFGADNNKDARFEAMKSCFKGQKRVYFHADNIQQLLDIIDFSKKMEIAFPVIIGAYESHLIARRLKDAKIPLMLTRTHSLPQNEDDPIDIQFRLPYLLQKEGVKFCLQNHGDMETMNGRNLPFLAGTAMAYGLSEEEAIRSITLSACEIMGIDKFYGSVEVGKNATFFISKGNALDMRSNSVLFTVSDGKIESVGTHQLDLYNKYQKKYRE